MKDSHALIALPPGGVLLDLQSGALLRLNEVATIVWRWYLDGVSISAIAGKLSARYGISNARARSDAERALSSSKPTPPPEPSGTYRYIRSPDGYVFSRLDESLLVVDGRGDTVTRHATARLTAAETQNYLVNLAPKILSLRGELVLHAAAVVLDGRAFVLSGHSGAGKTTTARALRDAGATLIAEDKVLIRRTPAGMGAVEDGERVIRAWAASIAEDVLAGRTASCAGLQPPDGASTACLTEIGFASAARRAAGPLVARVVPPADTAAMVFHNSFHGSEVPASWRRHLECSASIARQVEAYELTMPNTVAAVGQVAATVVGRRTLRS